MDELKHYGVKGMKWGVHRTHERSKKGRSSRSQTSKKMKHIAKSTVANGHAFVKNHKRDIVVATISAGLIASGHAYLGPYAGVALALIGSSRGDTHNDTSVRR